MSVATSTIPHRINVSDDAAYWTSGQVRQHFGGVSAMWISRRTKDQKFPAPVRFGTSRRFWKIADVLAWETDRAKQSAAS